MNKTEYEKGTFGYTLYNTDKYYHLSDKAKDVLMLIVCCHVANKECSYVVFYDNLENQKHLGRALKDLIDNKYIEECRYPQGYVYFKLRPQELIEGKRLTTQTHKELVDIAYKWVLKNASCGVAFKELSTLEAEIPDVIGFGAFGHSVVIECKATYVDFKADRKKPFRQNPEKGMGSHRYYCCPTGLIKPDELPEGWGLIYVDDKHKARCVVKPYKGNNVHRNKQDKNTQAEYSIMYSALRRLHLRGRIEEIYEAP